MSDDTPPVAELDLDRIDADLAGVEQALRRLDDGTYWNDELTGEPIDPEVLAADPIATRTAAERSEPAEPAVPTSTDGNAGTPAADAAD